MSTEFDAYAEDYDTALAQGLAVSGEARDYFARGRVAWVERCLRRLGHTPRTVLDFGCGTGATAGLLIDVLQAQSAVGVDTSVGALDVATRTCASTRLRFLSVAEYQPRGQMDFAFCNGVFHHIPPVQRLEAVEYIRSSLRPGGLFALWENNPWNPGTRYVMSRIPFDRDAVTVTAPEARRLLRQAGFDVVRTDFLFIFPRVLRWLRWIEPQVSKLPFGAQYQVLCRRR